MQKKVFIYLFITIAVILLDQFTKYLAVINLEPYTPVPMVPFFNLTLVFNPGAAFSLLNQGGWQQGFLFITSLLMSGVLLAWLLLGQHTVWRALALSLILGGAVGNLWDRVTLGFVIDFLDVYVQDWHWPTFNVADSAISLGMVGLVIDLFKNK